MKKEIKQIKFNILKGHLENLSKIIKKLYLEKIEANKDLLKSTKTSKYKIKIKPLRVEIDGFQLRLSPSTAKIFKGGKEIGVSDLKLYEISKLTKTIESLHENDFSKDIHRAVKHKILKVLKKKRDVLSKKNSLEGIEYLKELLESILGEKVVSEREGYKLTFKFAEKPKRTIASVVKIVATNGYHINTAELSEVCSKDVLSKLDRIFKKFADAFEF